MQLKTKGTNEWRANFFANHTESKITVLLVFGHQNTDCYYKGKNKIFEIFKGSHFEYPFSLRAAATFPRFSDFLCVHLQCLKRLKG